MTIVLISATAAGTHACHWLARELRQQGQQCLTAARLKTTRRQAFAPETLEADLPMTAAELLQSPLLMEASALGIFLSGEDLERFTRIYRATCRLQGRQPAPIFSGAPFPLTGDALVADLLSRRSADLLLVHGERHVEEAAAMTFGWDTPFPPVIAAGFWFMPERPAVGQLTGGAPISPPFTLVVLAQSSVPSSQSTRLDLFRRCYAWARESPEWTVIIQMDHQRDNPESWTTDKRVRSRHRPANLIFGAQEQLLNCIGRSSICLTVSSPWIHTAMAWGHPSVVLADYGIGLSEGTTGYLGSGALYNSDNFQNLDGLLELKPANQTWLQNSGWGVHDGASRLIKSLQSLQEENQ